MMVCIISSLFFGLVTFYYKQNLKIDAGYSEKEYLIVEMEPDSLEVNGDLLTFLASMPDSKIKLRGRIQLLNKKEQKFWLKNSKRFILQAKGNIEEAKPQKNLNGFDHHLYLSSIGVSAIFDIEEVKLLKEHKRFFDIQKFRRQMLIRIDGCFPLKTATYIKALLFGYRDSKFSEVREAYSSSGLLHLFSLSGLHVHFFLGTVSYFLRRAHLTSFFSLMILGPISVIAYSLFGCSVSVARALLYFFQAKLFKTFNYHSSDLDKFSICILSLLLVHPYAFYSLNGLLSISLSLILLVVGNQSSHLKFSKIKKAFWFQIAAIPIIFFSFYELPIFNSILNAIFIPVFQYGILPFLVLLFFLSFFKELIPIVTYFSEHFEKIALLIEKEISIFEHTTISASAIDNLTLLILLITALFLIQEFSNLTRKKQALLFLIICLPVFQKSLNPNGLVAFIDVGQGDSIFFRAPYFAETILIDTGGILKFKREHWQKRNQRAVSEYNLLPFLKSQGVSRLDKLVITHADEDHMGEVITLSKKILIRELYIADGVEKNPKMTALLKELKANGTTIHTVTAGDQIGKTFQFLILSPNHEVLGENNDSLVLWTKIKKYSFLLTGDLEEEGERQLIKAYPNLKTEVLKVGHHGSKSSSSNAFVQQISPSVSIISCGENNRFGHPHETVLEELHRSQIYRTDQSGMIYFQWSFFNDIQLDYVKKNQ